MMNKTEIKKIASQAAAHFYRGEIKLKDLMGLRSEEINSLLALADGQRRRGQIQAAMEILSMIISCDPLHQAAWQNMADLQHRVGQPLVAAACYEVVAMLSGRTVSNTQKQAQCFEQVGAWSLANKAKTLAMTINN